MPSITTATYLNEYLREVFSVLGMPKIDAEWISETLVQAELKGVSSHGVIRMPQYTKRLELSLANPKPNITILKDAGPLALLDGDNGMGQVVSRDAMRNCIERAKEHNVGVIFVKESNHFGAASTYTIEAARQGMIGICTTTTIPIMAPTGGKEPKIGNNPISIAFPSEPMMVLDMALSNVARGYVIEAARAGETIPDSWGKDSRGKSTTDPNEVLKSSLLSSIAGHKGSGLSIAIDAMLASISGSRNSSEIIGINDYSGKSGVTHLFIAIKIESLIPVNEFSIAANVFLQMLRDTKKADGIERIYMPGEIEYELEEKRKKNGFTLSKERINELDEIADRLNVLPLKRSKNE
ncbi:MAG: Ldh family oxidoreductase [Nitrospinota bacterium]|nr:Ldh family oxidoreductase [Nitrospinota bacterium]